MNTLSNAVDESHNESFVVNGAQRRGEHLFRLEQVMDVRRSVIRTRVAVTVLINRSKMPAPLRRRRIRPPKRRVQTRATSLA